MIENNNVEISSNFFNYSDLSEAEQKKVDMYLEAIDLNELSTVYEIGKNEIKKIREELEMFLGVLKEDKIGNLMGYNIPIERQTFIELLKDRILELLGNENSEKKGILSDIDQDPRKLESIRLELKIYAQKLKSMAESSKEQYGEIQYQFIALEELEKRLKGNENGAETLPKQAIRITNIIAQKKECLSSLGINVLSKKSVAITTYYSYEELVNAISELESIIYLKKAQDLSVSTAKQISQILDDINKIDER